MKYTVFEERLLKKIQLALPGAAPGVMVQVYQNGKKVCDIAAGDTYAYYDLASLTKIIFTTQAMMKLFQEGKWNLQTKVKEVISWFPHQEVLITELLNHSSGLFWWKPFYQEIDLKSTTPQKWKQLADMIAATPYEKTNQSIYSDLGFMTLAFVLEELSGKTLFETWSDLKDQFYPRLSFEFHPDNKPKNNPRFYAPTEKCPWRGRILQGEVHDENCWALGGVSTHAGLFASLDDVGWFGLFVRGQIQGISRTLIKQKTAQLFAGNL